MISFFLNLYRFAKVLYLGIKNDAEFRFLLVFILILLGGATLFYTRYEEWAVIDALYFSVVTMATIGYGDLVPSSALSKGFTIVYTFLSIGAFVAFTAKMVRLIFEDRKRKKQPEKQHK